MKKTAIAKFWLIIALGSVWFTPGAMAQPLTIRGYAREMPALQVNRDFTESNFVNLLQLRLNARLNLSEHWHLVAESRNRLFYNEIFSDFPPLRNIAVKDHGFADLSMTWLEKGAWLGNSMLDRLYIDFGRGAWQIRAGRQRINWGLNLVSNPNDLFNTYSFFDFDYVERPGSDALRIQYHTGFASRLEFAFSPAADSKNSTAAMLWAVNRGGYDLQLITAYYRQRAAAGLGWAGNIGGAGFKGEATWFYDLEASGHKQRGNLVVATGIDYIFSTGTFGVLEFLYNGGHERQKKNSQHDDPIDQPLLITRPLQADNIMFSGYALTLHASHPFSSLLQGGLAVMWLPDIRSAFVMPNLKYSLAENFDMELVVQWFAGGSQSPFEQAGAGFFVAWQYSF